MRSATLILAMMLTTSAVLAAEVDVLVQGTPRAQYFHNGTTYIEALRGAEFTLQLTNPSAYRVAVALSVDGLNTIDARHTDGWNASKWVLAPYETVEISGWQVSESTARRFFFTGEQNSYAASLGQTENLGVIEAIFYRERQRPIAQYDERQRKQSRDSAGPAPPSAAAQGIPRDDEYAATGMGDRTAHDVVRVSIDLDPHPIARARIRYEFRPQLVKLGVLDRVRSPLERRERARGFEYCPEP